MFSLIFAGYSGFIDLLEFFELLFSWGVQTFWFGRPFFVDHVSLLPLDRQRLLDCGSRHSHKVGNPATYRSIAHLNWIPAFAEMTVGRTRPRSIVMDY